MLIQVNLSLLIQNDKYRQSSEALQKSARVRKELEIKKLEIDKTQNNELD